MDDHNALRTTSHNVTSHGTQRGTQRDVTVHEAAAALGLSEEAVRARLRRGTLDGYKADDGTWRVHMAGNIHDNIMNVSPQSGILDNVQGSSDVTGVTPPLRDGTHHVTSHEAQHGTQRNVTDDALVTHLQDEVTYLRERLEDAMGQLAEERRRADTLTALSASVRDDPRDEDHTVEEPAETRLVGFLARLRAWLTGER